MGEEKREGRDTLVEIDRTSALAGDQFHHIVDGDDAEHLFPLRIANRKVPKACVAQDAHRLQCGVPFMHPHKGVGHSLPEGEVHGSSAMARALPHEVAGYFVEGKKSISTNTHDSTQRPLLLPFGEESCQATSAVLHHHGADVSGIHLSDCCSYGIILSQRGHGCWILPRSLLVQHLLHGHISKEHQVFVKGLGSSDRLAEVLSWRCSRCGGTTPQGCEPSRYHHRWKLCAHRTAETGKETSSERDASMTSAPRAFHCHNA